MYSVEEIKELLKAFNGSKATKIEIVAENGEALTITQKTAGVAAAAAVPAAVSVAADEIAEEKQSFPTPFIHEETKQEDGKAVTSPMVGVFYAAPSPDQEPYVSVGSKVNKGDVLCLIEAMKLMNEVTAEQSGEIAAVCAENGQVVEYGQTLFTIK